jgi:3-isopropylmalate/(R)-2-methylmalate dehydratase large subunit
VHVHDLKKGRWQQMGMTLAEKILARASGRDAAVAGEFVVAKVDLAMTHDIFAAQVFDHLVDAGISRVFDQEHTVVVMDHLVPPSTEAAAEQHQRIREHVGRFGIENFYEAGSGICHQLLPERGHVWPGMLVVGTDSHTTTHGALGAASTGIGTSEMAYALATGTLWFRVPETIRFDLEGSLDEHVSWKDVVLWIAGRFGSDVAQYRSIEFAGPAASQVSVSSRLTICNMAVEMGAKFGMFAPDQVTADYLAGLEHSAGVREWRRRFDEKRVEADPDASYLAVHKVPLCEIGPQVALPHEVDHVVPVAEAVGTVIQQAFIGSCTNGRLEDLAAAAAVLKGRQVAPGVRLIVAPASRWIFQEALRQGIIQILADAGASVLPAGCGPCFGGHGGLLAAGERCIGTHNRNFVGRMGSARAEIFLASPETVAASAVAGHIADPRELAGQSSPPAAPPRGTREEDSVYSASHQG